jgi:hypothetical protein
MDPTMRGAADRQWIRIRGANASNPVLFLIQQGPGLPMINEVRRFEHLLGLEQDFTVIYWDQRGCGRSLRGSALRRSALAGGPSGYGGDRRVGLAERLRCSGGWITLLGGLRQAMHERPGQRQGDGQQQPHPQAPGEKCPHAQGPFVVVLREVLRRYPPCPGLTTSRAAYYSSRT